MKRKKTRKKLLPGKMFYSIMKMGSLYLNSFALHLLTFVATASMFDVVFGEDGYRWPIGIQPIKMEAALIKYRIIPDCVDSISEYDLLAEFEPNKPVYYGNFIQPTADLTHFFQHMEWDTVQLDHFTFMFLGLDEPSYANPSKREYIFMLITNIHSYGAIGGHEIIEYKQPKVTKTSGKHRYVLLVYLQPDRNLTVGWPVVNSSSEAHRANFDNRKFAKKHKLGRPYAMNFFISHWVDPNVPLTMPTTPTESTTNIWQKLAAEKRKQQNE